MRRLILILLLLVVLGGTLLGAERLNWIGSPATDTTTSANGTTAAPLRRIDGFRLKMSPRLSRRPAQSTSARAPAATAPSWWQRLDLRWFALMLGASLLGMAFVRAWRGPIPAPTTEPAPPQRSEPVFDNDAAVDNVNAATMRALRERLAAVEDDLHSSNAAREELAAQLKEAQAQLGEAQENAVELQATITQRDNDIADIKARLTATGTDTEQRDARISDLEQALAHANDQTQAAQQQISLLDQDGVDQRVITVDFEKALLAADAQLASTTRSLEQQRNENTELSAQLHAADQELQALHDDTEAQVATLTRETQREREALEAELRATIDTLTQERDTLTASLNDAQASLAERDTNLENLRQDLALHVDQVASLGEVRDRLNAWQPTVDTLRADLRDKDKRNQELRTELDETTEQLIAARALADEVAPLHARLEEQSALSRVLKDAADSMRLYKNAADTRGFQISKLKEQLTAQIEQTREARTAHETTRSDVSALHSGLTERDEALHDAQLRAQQNAARAAEYEEQFKRESSALREAREQLQEREASLERANQLAQERATRIEQLEQTLQVESNALDELRNQLSDQQSQRAALEEEVGELETLSRDFGHLLEASLPEIDDEIEFDAKALHRDARHSVQRVRERLEIVQDLERALELDLEDSNACLRMTESESIRVNDALNALLPEFKSAASERDQAQARVQELEQQVARIDEALRDRSQLESRCAELQSELNDWSERENDVVARIDALAEDRSELARRLAQTRSTHDEAAASAQREQVRRVSLQHATDQQLARISALEDQLQERTATDSELADTRKQLDTARAELESLQRELEERDSQWASVETHLETRLANAEEALARSRGEYVAKAAEVDEIIRASHAQRDELSAKLQDALGSQQQHEQRDEELAKANLALRDALKSVRAQTDSQIQRLRSDLELAEKTGKTLTQKLETSARTQATYAKAVAKLKSELARSQTQVKVLDKAVATLRQKFEAEKRAKPPSVAPKVVDKPVSVPVLSRPVSAPPVLTRPLQSSGDEES
jgi:chromosome segregation ATPase